IMKRVLILFGLILTLGLFFTSCYKDVILPEAAVDPDGPPQAVSYSLELAPLFNSSCALSGCHVVGGHKPYMNTDISYQQIVNGGFVNTDIPKQSILYIEINGEMKEHIPSASDRQKVYDWIRNGAPNN
ncbi:MAG TPA: hypothetical protein VLS85_07945, partial [Hanamia sp.]|nr:hypothetical protein [Hanamia sp.]